MSKKLQYLETILEMENVNDKAKFIYQNVINIFKYIIIINFLIIGRRIT